MGIYQEVKQELGKLTTDDQIINLVLAALGGEEDVKRALAGEVVDVPDTPDIGERIPPVYLQDITVSGFRGIGPEATLKISPGPGLTVVVGRNGSGKSSFAEGLEVLLTGESYRWEGKTVVWKKGWRNLHQGDNPKISARFQVEGKKKPTMVERTWSQNSKLEEGKCTAQHHGQNISDLDGIGWTEPLGLYRPLLSYNELNISEKRPTDFFKALGKVLGLDTILQALDTLAEARLTRHTAKGIVTKELQDDVLPPFEKLKSEDPRAGEVVESLNRWELDSLEKLRSEPNTHHRDSQRLMGIEIPDKEQVLEVAEGVSEAYTDWTDLSGTELENSARMVKILNSALEHYKRHKDNPCPVCGVGILDSEWHTNVVENIKQQKKKSQHYSKAQKNLEDAINRVQALVKPPRWPSFTYIDIDSLVSIWEKWSSLPDNPGDVYEHLVSVYPSVKNELDKLSKKASQMYSEKEEKWQKAWSYLSPWIPKARNVIRGRTEISIIKKAESLLKSVNENLRSVRWSSVEKQSLDIWKDLRLDSNVNLRSVQLTGSRTRRRVDLVVEVDGIKAEAFSVVSQGELTCLALSLFFPRATLPTSPFRFLVIDDPVQSMDPARVDGLARLFAKIAKDRQLIVFTHDDRLTRSLRVLNLEYKGLEVTRSLKSVLSIISKPDPVLQYFSDAYDVMNNKSLPQEVSRRVIPGFCRRGLEAACVETVRRRRLGSGESIEKIDQELSKAKKLSEKISLVLFDNRRKINKIYSEISSKWNKHLATAYNDTNEGTHGKYSGNLKKLIKDSRQLAEKLRCYDL